MAFDCLVRRDFVMGMLRPFRGKGVFGCDCVFWALRIFVKLVNMLEHGSVALVVFGVGVF